MRLSPIALARTNGAAFHWTEDKLDDPELRIQQYMDQEMLDRVKKFCLETWGLSNPDQMDLFHGFRILKIQDTGNPDINLSFDDFCVAIAPL